MQSIWWPGPIISPTLIWSPNYFIKGSYVCRGAYGMCCLIFCNGAIIKLNFWFIVLYFAFKPLCSLSWGNRCHEMKGVRLMTSSTTPASNCLEIHCIAIHPNVKWCLTMSASWDPVDLSHQSFSKWVLFTESEQPLTLHLRILKALDNLFKHCDCKVPEFFQKI